MAASPPAAAEDTSLFFYTLLWGKGTLTHSPGSLLLQETLSHGVCAKLLLTYRKCRPSPLLQTFAREPNIGWGEMQLSPNQAFFQLGIMSHGES